MMLETRGRGMIKKGGMKYVFDFVNLVPPNFWYNENKLADQKVESFYLFIYFNLIF